MKKTLLIPICCILAACNTTYQGEEYMPQDEGVVEEVSSVQETTYTDTQPTYQNQTYLTATYQPQPMAYRTGMTQSAYPAQPAAYPVTVSYVARMPQPMQVQAQSMYVGATAVPALPAAMPVSYNIPEVVLLQHPNAVATFVQCAGTDTACVAAYQQQGYILLQTTPRAAGYYMQPAAADYPGGRWGAQTIMPRW